MVACYVDISNFNVRSNVDLAEPTEDSLEAEAEALGSKFTRVSAHPADIIADADEMRGAAEDNV